MALFQPSHIVPSSLSGLGNGVVASADKAVITWQVNGNSPLTAFSIDVYENTALSALVHSTGTISTGYGLPFYGTDNKGNPKTFTYAPNVTWASWGLSDGNNYKLKITQYWNGTSNSVTQYSESAFIARTAPTLTLFSVPSTIETVSYDFQATFSQAQGDGVNWIRWQMATVSDGNYTVIDDTGEINTASLAYSFDGFMTGNTYAIQATSQSQQGIVTTTGWVQFDVSYQEAGTSGGINLQYDPENECALLSWQKGTNIPSTSQQGISILGNGNLNIASGGHISWTTVDGDPMSFSSPYSAYWKGVIPPIFAKSQFPDIFAMSITCSAFSSDGQKLVFGSSGGYLYIYEKDGNGNFQYSQSINTETGTRINCIAFSPSDSIFVVGGGDSSGGIAYVYNGSTYAYITNLVVTVFGQTRTAAFSPDGSLLCLGGDFSKRAWLFTVSGTTVSSVGNIQGASGDIAQTVFSAAFSPDGTALFIGGGFDGYLYAYTVSGTTVTYSNTVEMQSGTTFDGYVNTMSFAGSNTLAVGGAFSEIVSLYTVSGASATFKTDIPYLVGTVDSISANAQGNLLAIAGNFTASAYLYDISGTTPSLIANVPTAEGATTFCNFSKQDDSVVFCTSGLEEAELFDISLPTIQAVSFGNDLTIAYQNGNAVFTVGANIVSVPAVNSTSLAQGLFGVTPDGIMVYWLDAENNLLGSASRSLTYAQPSITSVTLTGEQTNVFAYITEGLETFSAPYDPVRDYTSLFFTDYSTAEFQAGSLAGSTTQNALYRVSGSEGVLSSVYKFPTSVNRIRDFGVKSLQRYYWEMFFVTSGDEYSTPLVTSEFCKQFKAFTLIEATQDPDYPNVYHALNVWRFGSNVNGWSVSNNNSPALQQNFTKYPYRQPSTQMYKSGTLQALLSNPKDGVYQDTARQMELLYTLSQSLNPIFLRDVKGNLYMVHTEGAITQNMSTTSTRNQVDVSVPWVEVGDATGVSIIQTPLDEGWENNQVTQVQTSVNASTGYAVARYPSEYRGTTFGTDGFNLVASTPKTMEAPALEVIDGELNASV